MDKKGDLSINIIVIAAIALIILVIMSVLLFQSGGNLRRGTSCEGVGGVCVDRTQFRTCAEYAEWGSYDGQNYRRHTTAACPTQDELCCVRI